MKLFLKTFFILAIITVQLFSQTEHDTSKTLRNKKNTVEEKKQLNTNSNRFSAEKLNHLEIRQDNFVVPLNLKIYQKIFADEKFEIYTFTQEYLNSGLSNNELMIFDQNKLLTKRMLSDTYGEDIIDLKKILKTLGITQDQLVMIFAILRFFLYTPIL
jgi:hypothetical protein